MAFGAPTTLSHQAIVSTIDKLDLPLVKQVQLFDEYTGEQIEAGTRSLAYRVTLQSETETLTDKIIDDTMATLKNQLTQSHDISFR